MSNEKLMLFYTSCEKKGPYNKYNSPVCWSIISNAPSEVSNTDLTSYESLHLHVNLIVSAINLVDKATSYTLWWTSLCSTQFYAIILDSREVEYKYVTIWQLNMLHNNALQYVMLKNLVNISVLTWYQSLLDHIFY